MNLFQDRRTNTQAAAENTAGTVNEISIAEEKSPVLKWDKRKDGPKAKLCPLKVPYYEDPNHLKEAWAEGGFCPAKAIT